MFDASRGLHRAGAPVRLMAATLLVLVASSCGGTDEAAIPTTEELAASLLTAEDLGEE
jgi:hypothetical protein